GGRSRGRSGRCAPPGGKRRPARGSRRGSGRRKGHAFSRGTPREWTTSSDLDSTPRRRANERGGSRKSLRRDPRGPSACRRASGPRVLQGFPGGAFGEFPDWPPQPVVVVWIGTGAPGRQGRNRGRARDAGI